MDPGTISTVVTATVTGIDIGKQVKKLGPVNRFFVKLWPKHHILLLGSSGTGKTNLVNSLAEIMPSAIDRLDRTTRSKSHIFKIKGQYFHFIDIPGQELSETERTETIQESLHNAEGIINVVCYGYHEGSFNSQNQAVVDEDNPNNDFLKKRREEEIHSLIEFSKFYGQRSKPTWMLTVVSKADLWWDQSQEVIDYYHSGEYGQFIRTKLNSLKHGCVTYCSVIHKYYDKLKLSGNFDDEERSKCKKIFISKLLEMALARKRKH